MPNEEEKYIHSLFRCMNWDAKGGKSNSQFRKTLDNRFVLKEMSKQEVLSFLDFAPQYVSYVTDSIKNKKATGLTKILGAYRICLMKNTTISSKAVKMDVIVLENLFYSKKFSQVFDLKGSERNRMVNEKHIEKDIVLLDENFLRCKILLKYCQKLF
jgi:1-phosphatidylinositol-3-phosphate 5-kinase